MPALRVLVVSYFYPPDDSVGSHRWPAMARYLRRLGHEVTILTTSAFGTLPDDEPWVVRTRDLQGAATLRRLLRRPPVVAGASAPANGAPGAGDAGSAGDAGDAGSAGIGSEAGSAGPAPVPPAPRILTDGLVPDAHVASWLPFVVPTVRRLVRERAIDCVVTNGPPDSTHLLGLALGRRRPAWVLDMEDGWRFEPLREPWPTRMQDRLDAALERRVAHAADGGVGLAEPIAVDLATRLGAHASYVPNAWDPDLDAAVDAATTPELEPGTFSLVHPGGLSHGRRRDPRPLFAALGALAREAPEDAARLRLVLAGRLSAADAALLDELPAETRALVRHVGALSREQAVALQRRADALLLIVTGEHRSQVTGKLFEYLAAGRPILALADDNEAARIVRATGTGVVVDPSDAAAIAAALRAAIAGELAGAYAPRGVDAYRFPGPAKAMAEAIEAAIERRARSARDG